MPTQIYNSSNKIAANGTDYYSQVNSGRKYKVIVDFETPGSGGTVTITDAQGNPYYDSAGNAATVAYNHVAGGTNNKFIIDPTGDRIYYVAASFGGGASASVRVIEDVSGRC